MKQILTPVSAVLNLVQALLILMVHGYDKYVYTPIQWISSPFVRVIPREINGHQIFTANIVTYSRTLLVIPIAVCLKLSLFTEAFFLVILHDYLDHLDGIVAKVHKALGHKDDPLLGSFLDAFCDKIVNVFALWSILLLANYGGMNYFCSATFLATCSLVIAYELVLGLVRVQDYYHCRYGGETPRNLAASMEGKLKEKLESTGIACLCLASSNPFNSPILAWTGIICLAFSLKLAHASLAHKLSARKVTLGNNKDTEKAEKSESEPYQDLTASASSEVIARAGPRLRDSIEMTAEDGDNSYTQQLNEKKELAKTASAEDLTIAGSPATGRTVYSIGCFDLFHWGHKALIDKMRQHGERIVIGIHDDESIYKLKKKYPVDPLEKRIANLKKHVEQVYVIPATDPTPYIDAAIDRSTIAESCYLRGDDMPNFPARNLIEKELRMNVVFVPYTQGVSSTQLRNEMIKNGTYVPRLPAAAPATQS